MNNDETEKKAEPDYTTRVRKIEKRRAKIVTITPNWIIVDVGGNGERLPYNKEKHFALKIGDEIDI